MLGRPQASGAGLHSTSWPGDLCLVLVDQVQEALAHLARRVEAG